MVDNTFMCEPHLTVKENGSLLIYKEIYSSSTTRLRCCSRRKWRARYEQKYCDIIFFTNEPGMTECFSKIPRYRKHILDSMQDYHTMHEADHRTPWSSIPESNSIHFRFFVSTINMSN